MQTTGGIAMGAKAKQSEEAVEEVRRPLVETVHTVLLAAVGAVALAQDELEDFVNKLVERGEIAEKDGRAMIRDLREKRRKKESAAEQAFESQVEDFMERLDVPTKSDIEDLSAKIAELSEKVDQLKQE
jgi:poly(hydroxyalkanoate) granule-associated protein